MEEVALETSADTTSNYQFDYYALSKLRKKERRKISILLAIIALLLLCLIIFVILYTESSAKTEVSSTRLSYLGGCVKESDCSVNAYCAFTSHRCQCKRGFIGDKEDCKDIDFSIEFSNRTIKNVPQVHSVKFPQTKELSACVWYRLNVLPDGWKAVFMYTSYDIEGENDFMIWLQENKITVSRNKDFDIVTNFTFTVNTWNHICYVWKDTGNIKLYQNAKLIKELTTNQSEFIMPFPESSGTLILGQDVDAGHISEAKQMFEGRLFNLFIYKRVLSDDEVFSVFENNPPLNDIIVGWWQFKGKANSREIMEKPYPFDIEQIQ